MGRRVRFTGTTEDLDRYCIGRDRDPGLYEAVESGNPVLGTVTQDGFGAWERVRFDDSNIDDFDVQENGWFVQKDYLAEVGERVTPERTITIR